MTAYTMRFVASVTTTSTLASGAKAREMLDEMLAGQGLLFRQKAATVQFGIPSGEANAVGQITSKGFGHFARRIVPGWAEGLRNTRVSGNRLRTLCTKTLARDTGRAP